MQRARWCTQEGAACLRGFASVSNEQIDSRTFDIVSAGLHSVLKRTKSYQPSYQGHPPETTVTQRNHQK